MSDTLTIHGGDAVVLPPMLADEKADNLRRVVAIALARAPDGFATAMDELADHEWTAEETAILIRAGLRVVMGSIANGQHRKVERRAMKSATQPQGAGFSINHAAQVAFMDAYRLAGGKTLRLATRGDLLDSAERHEALAAGNALEARYQRLLAERVPEGATVGETLADNDVLAMRRAVNGE